MSRFAEPASLDLSVVILSWNTADLLEACLRALRANPFAGSHEIIVVDNASGDDSVARVKVSFPDVRLIENAENRGYSGGNNDGLRIARGRYLLLLNSDTEVGPGALDRLGAFLRNTPGAGAVTCKLTNPDGTLQTSCMRFPTMKTAMIFDTCLRHLGFGKRHLDRYFMRDFDHLSEREVDQIPGTCTLMPRSVVEEIGFLDEKLWLFFNDVDLCKRIRHAGHSIHFLADVSILHHYGASTSKFVAFAVEWHKNRVAYYRKHFGGWSVLVTKPVALYVGLRQMWLFTFCGHAPKGTYRENMAFVVKGIWGVLLRGAWDSLKRPKFKGVQCRFKTHWLERPVAFRTERALCVFSCPARVAGTDISTPSRIVVARRVRKLRRHLTRVRLAAARSDAHRGQLGRTWEANRPPPLGWRRRTLRDQLLNGEIFYTLREAKVLLERWHWHYNRVRPHSSLGNRPPAPEAVLPRAPGS